MSPGARHADTRGGRDEPWTAVIPLRAGSRGLPGKNTRTLAGRPLYRHSVEAAIAAGAGRVIISTDIPEVIAASHAPCVEVMERPAALCGDSVPMAAVLLQALVAARVSGPVVLLQATSPLRRVGDIRSALATLREGRFDVVMSVTEADRTVLKWGTVEQGAFQPLARAELCFANRQDLPAVYRPNGAVYAMQAAWFVANGGFQTERIGTVVMPADRSEDIDGIEDFMRCEAWLAARDKGASN